MMTERLPEALDPISIIEGHVRLTEIFGRWPSFHDSEIMSIHLERRGDVEWEGAFLDASIHLCEGYNDSLSANSIKYRNHTIATFRFVSVLDLSLTGFNQQNAIMDFNIYPGVPKSKDITWQGPSYEVVFSPAFGVSCSFLCARIELIGIEKSCPKGSVYA